MDDLDLDSRRPVGLQRPEHLFALHRKQSDFRLQCKSLDLLTAAAKRLVVPDHIGKVEGNLLAGFIADNLWNLLGLDRRQLDEPRQPILPRHRNRHAVAPHAVPRLKLLQGVVDQFNRIGPRLRQELRILNVVKCNSLNLLRILSRSAANRLEGGIADINSPDGVTSGHQTTPIALIGGIHGIQITPRAVWAARAAPGRRRLTRLSGRGGLPFCSWLLCFESRQTERFAARKRANHRERSRKQDKCAESSPPPYVIKSILSPHFLICQQNVAATASRQASIARSAPQNQITGRLAAIRTTGWERCASTSWPQMTILNGFGRLVHPPPVWLI